MQDARILADAAPAAEAVVYFGINNAHVIILSAAAFSIVWGLFNVLLVSA